MPLTTTLTWCFMIICLSLYWKPCQSLRRVTDTTDNEIQEIVTQLWDADADNRAKPGEITLNFQNAARAGDHQDHARSNFFSSVNVNLLNRPTYLALNDTIRDYIRFGAVQIPNFAPWKTAIEKFLNSISETPPYAILKKALSEAGYGSATDRLTFDAALTKMWFGNYGREGGQQSSGFGHVFVGERKGTEATGLHNWMRLYYLEKYGNLDYAGYIDQTNERLPTIEYKYGNVWKDKGSMMVGTSPAFDFAIFTLCFVTRPGKSCDFFLGDCTSVRIISHESYQAGKIGTAFPMLWRVPKNSCPFRPIKPQEMNTQQNKRKYPNNQQHQHQQQPAKTPKKAKRPTIRLR